MPAAPIPANEAERVADLRSYELLDTFEERGYDDITFLASYICEAPVSLITLVDRERQWFKSAVGTSLTETTRADSFCSYLVATSQVMVVEDATLDVRFADNPLVTGDAGFRFYAGAPLITPDGNVIGSVCVLDQKPHTLRSEQVRALESLARQVMARMELRRQIFENQRTSESMRTAEKLAAVGRMASSVAHEINNPLQSVTNLLYMVKAEQNANDREVYLGMAQDELTRVTQIVTQALRFHQQSSSATPVRLAELAESTLLLFRTRLRHAGAQVQVRDSQLRELVGFADDIRQVLAHLTSNALDALNHKGGGDLYARIYDGHDGRTGRPGVFLTIADSGVGISQDARQRLFQPFFTTKGIRGTGLGLWVSKGILDKHGARIVLRSREGVGTVVRIFFPSAAAMALSAISPAAQEYASLPVN